MKPAACLPAPPSATRCPTGRPATARPWPVVAALLVLALPVLLGLDPRAQADGWPWLFPFEPPQQPHPSVARVIVKERNAVSQGSATLVDARDRFGLVVTNWHVVRDASESIHVVFPDGFHSAARILHMDRDWDLAALLIWRPPASPVSLASRAPLPGDLLTVAGYGRGTYRASTGRCTQYVAPSGGHPFEMVEVATTVRQGDSGGPIFNEFGQLAGVLFGSDGGSTSGSYSGRVAQFLRAAWPPATAVPEPPRRVESPQLVASNTSSPPKSELQPLPSRPGADLARSTAHLSSPSASETQHPAARSPTANNPPQGSAHTRHATVDWSQIVGYTPLEQIKTALAAVGVLAIVVRLFRRSTQ
ncbi:MAG: trypsin-like serine protease [Planctomycetes bacterium]|nr:trypsin-like serine protease [Planctomycetota bacterium]